MRYMHVWADALPRLIDLQLFAEGGDGSAAGGASAGADSSTPPQSSNNEATQDVGKGAGADAASAAKTYTDEDARAVSKQFNLMTHTQAKTRYKGAIERGAKYDALAVKMQAVAEQYGKTADASPEDILDAMLTGSGRVRERAEQLGVDEETAARIIRTENENAMFRAQQAQEQNRATLERRVKEENDVKAAYADFNYRAEAENPVFKTLVDGGLPMKQAYEMVHAAELSAKAIALAREEARAAALAEYRANGARPAEGISGNKATGVVKNDYTKMSQQDLLARERELMNGLRRKA